MKNFPYYPIYLDIEDRSAVIIGGGEVCARQAQAMLKYGARVTVVAPECTAEIERWAAEGALTIARKHYDERDLDGATIVVASTDNPIVNEKVAADCRRRRIPVHVVDVTELSEFIVPAIVESGSIQLAISTGNKSPAVASALKQDLQKLIGPEYAEINDVLATLRDGAREALPTDADREEFFDGILAGGVLQMLREGRRTEAYQAIADACEASGVPASAQVRRGLAG